MKMKTTYQRLVGLDAAESSCQVTRRLPHVQKRLGQSWDTYKICPECVQSGYYFL